MVIKLFGHNELTTERHNYGIQLSNSLALAFVVTCSWREPIKAPYLFLERGYKKHVFYNALWYTVINHCCHRFVGGIRSLNMVVLIVSFVRCIEFLFSFRLLAFTCLAVRH